MRPESRPLVRRVLAGLLAVVAFAVAWFTLFRQGPDPPQVTAAPEPAKVELQPLFEKWPQDRKPDLVIVLGSDHLETFFLHAVPAFAIVGGLHSKAAFARRNYSLPIHPFLSASDVQTVIDACNSWEPK